MLDDNIEGDSHESGKELSAWLEQAQLVHPAIAAAKAQLAAAEQKVVATRAEGLPTVDFTGSYYQNGRPNQGLTTIYTKEQILGVALTIPIFDGFSRTYKVRGAQAQVELREAELHDTEHQIMMDVVKAHADATASFSNLSASEDLVSAAQASADAVQRKFDKGAADILEILNVQTALSDAQQERIRCLAEWRAARLHLLTSAGLMGQSVIKQ